MYEGQNFAKQLDAKQIAQRGRACAEQAVGGTLGGEKTRLRDKSSIDEVIDQIFTQIGAAEVNFQNLVDKVKPVISQSAAAGCIDNSPTNPAKCELEERLLQIEHRLSVLSDNIYNLTAKVCL
jgi:hypothetical protein